MLNTIDEGIKAVRQGKIVIVVDDENRENEGDFIVSGEKITPDIVNFMITHNPDQEEELTYNKLFGIYHTL